MKTTAVALVALVSLVAGAALHAVFRPADPAPVTPSPQTPPSLPDGGLEAEIRAIGQRLDGLSSRVAALSAQNASEWKQVRELLAKASARAAAAETSGPSAGADGSARGPVPLTESVEELKARWRESIDTFERRVLEMDPAGWNSKDSGTQARLGDLRLAREALEQANDEAALRKLAVGGHSYCFKLEKTPSEPRRGDRPR